MLRCDTLGLTQLFLFIAVLFRSGLCHGHDHIATKTDEFSYGDLFEVRDVEMDDQEFADRMFFSRRRLPMGRELAFTAVGPNVEYRVSLNLELTEVYGAEAKVYGALAGDTVPHDRSYRGDGTIKKCTKDGDCKFYAGITKVSVTFFESFGEHVFHALLRTDSEEFAVDPKRLVNKERYKNGASFPATDSPLSELEPDMYFFSSSNLFEKSVNEATGDLMYTPKRRLLQQLEVFTNCYEGQGQATYRISMGMLIDDGFFAAAGGNGNAVRDYVAGMFNDMNTMYSNQMGVEIALHDLILGDTTGFDRTTFNEAPRTPGRKTCPSGRGATARVNQLLAWRQTYKPTTFGLWHLMTNCHPAVPGTLSTVGIAAGATLCEISGVGLSNYLGSATWECLAHEVGHNFGARHTFDYGLEGGIMDYSDGLLNGVYQIHPVHKNEICTEISDSMTRRRDIPNCWTADTAGPSNPNPRPTNPTPTPRPTNPIPTPRPTISTPRPTGIIPTRRPTQTPRPTTTASPTGVITARGGVIFKWVNTGVYGSCSVSCGSGFRTENVVCTRFDLGTCPSLGAVDTTTCSSSTFVNGGCSSRVVHNFFCSAGCRPEPAVAICNDGSCGGNTCGNGQLEKDEYCEPGLDSCCNASCTGWKETTECQDNNPIVDAAVMDYDQRLYLFQGRQFAVFETMDDTTPIEGYPKPLSTIENLNANFVNGIDSAASFYDDYVFLFKGMTFVIVDLEEMAQLRGEYNVASYMNMGSSRFRTCAETNGISAVLSYFFTLDLICDDIVAEFSWRNRGIRGTELVADKYNFQFPANVAGGQPTAAVRNPKNGRIRFYQGSYQSEWRSGETTPTVRQSPVFAGREVESCLVDNCSECTADLALCTMCNTGYKLKRQGRLCKRPRNFLDLSFDDNGYTEAFMQTVSGEEVAAADNGGWPIDGEIVEGAFGYGLHLNGGHMTRLQSFDFDSETVEHWKVSFYWKPDTLGRQRLLTLNRDRGNGYNEQFTIDFVTESDTKIMTSNTFAIEVWMYDTQVDCYVDNPITVGQWNKVSIEFGLGHIITSANGVYHRLGLENVGSDDYAVDFKDWYLGERPSSALRGLSGTIDKFEVSNLDVKELTGASAMPVWMLATILGGSGLALLLLCFLAYRCGVCSKCCNRGPKMYSERSLPPAVPKNSPSVDELDVDFKLPQFTGIFPKAYNAGGVRGEPDSDSDVEESSATSSSRVPPRAPGSRVPPRPPMRQHRLDLGLSPRGRKQSWNV